MRKYVKLQLTDSDWRLALAGLTHFRNDRLRRGEPTEEVDHIIMRLICSPCVHEYPKSSPNGQNLMGS